MQSVNGSDSPMTTSEDIISERVLGVTAVTVRVFLNSGLALCSLITNIVNALVFRRMGIDHATESFFILSLADCLVGLFGTIAGICNGVRYLGPPHLAGSMYSLYVLLLAAATVPSLTSLVSTTVIALVRCCSVALPFRVRTVFTARRQRIVILFCTALSIAFLSYNMVGTRLIVRMHPKTNVSQLVILFHPKYIEKGRYSDVLRALMFYSCFFTVCVCLIVLIIALKRSSNFREGSWSSQKDRGRQSEGGPNLASEKPSGFSACKPGRKEVQVVKVVVLVSALFVICQLPAVVVSVLRQVVPGLNNLGSLQKSFDFGMIFLEFFQLVNASMNTFIYLQFNTRYCTALRQLLGRKGRKH